MTLGTKMARIGLGDCDKFIEDGLDGSINANTYWIASPH